MCCVLFAVCCVCGWKWTRGAAKVTLKFPRIDICTGTMYIQRSYARHVWREKKIKILISNEPWSRAITKLTSHTYALTSLRFEIRKQVLCVAAFIYQSLKMKLTKKKKKETDRHRFFSVVFVICIVSQTRAAMQTMLLTDDDGLAWLDLAYG